MFHSGRSGDPSPVCPATAQLVLKKFPPPLLCWSAFSQAGADYSGLQCLELSFYLKQRWQHNGQLEDPAAGDTGVY